MLLPLFETLLKKTGRFLTFFLSIGLIAVFLLNLGQVTAQTTDTQSVEKNNDKTTIQNIRIWDAPDHTRMVFDLSASSKFNTFVLDNPKRFVIDIADGKNAAQIPDLTNNPRLSSLRHGGLNEQTYRYVLEVQKAYKVNTFQLDPNELYGYRLVIDLFDINDNAVDKDLNTNKATTTDLNIDDKDQSNSLTKGSGAEASPRSSQGKKNTQTAALIPFKQRKLNVAIDAGHGGDDPGAIGYKRLREKHIVLAIAKKLQKIINQDQNMNAFLTRKSDYFVELRNRTAIAKDKGADLFISIHADAFAKKTASGFSVFALSQRGASSELARTLARKENAADLIGGVSIKDKDDVLAEVLIDLSMTKSISEGVEFGNFVLKELGKLGKLHGRRVEQAGFAVLKSPDIPSILVETGFITNPAEAKRLNTDSFQNKIAKALYTAIKNYSRKNPVFEQRTNLVFDTNIRNNKPTKPTNNEAPSKGQSNVSGKNALIHKVKRGEFLASIAKKHNVSVANLRSWNNLKSTKIFIGQKLRVSATSEQVSNSSTNSKSNRVVRYKVRSGDNLSTLADRYDVSVKAIKSENNLKKNSLSIGQVLKIPQQSNNATAKKSSSNRQLTKTIVHTVKNGQTLSGIAEKYKVKMSIIKRDNNLKKSSLRIGQKLKIKTTKTLPKQIVHKVRNGENLSLIAKRYGVSVRSIRQKNKLKSSKLFVGQKLKI